MNLATCTPLTMYFLVLPCDHVKHYTMFTMHFRDIAILLFMVKFLNTAQSYIRMYMCILIDLPSQSKRKYPIGHRQL